MRLNRNTLITGGLALGLLAASSLFAESVYVATISDVSKKDTYEVLTREALATLKNQIKAEARVFPAALAAAKKEWEADDMTKASSFPATGLAPRTVREEGPLSEEVARKKAEKKAERDMESDFDKAASKTGSAKNKPSEKELEKQEKKARKDAQIDAAATLVQKHLETLAKGTK